MNISSRTYWGRTLVEWFSTLPVFILMLLTLIIGTGEIVHGQLLKVGERFFGDPASGVQYFMLRTDPVKPTCNPNINIDEEVQKRMATSSAEEDPDANLFGEVKEDPQILRKSIESALVECQFKHDLYNRTGKHVTPQLKVYRTLETSFFALFQLGTENRALMLLLLVAIASITATIGYHHICIRPPHYQKDFKVQNIAIALASSLLLWSAIRYYQISKESGIELDHPFIYYLWIILFGVLLLIALYRIVFPSPAEKDSREKGSWAHGFIAIPLFAYMALISGVYFLIHQHEAGLAIQINRLLDLPIIFLNLALFIWSGMLLKQSRLVDLFMNVVRPWRFSPELLTYIILLAAALPTAYTGASGIWVIAAGAIVYHEIRAVGGSRQFALAATAMSGSLGVVLRPCLLVVLIAAYNKQVTTNSLYYWGTFVFLLTSTLFFLASQMQRTKRLNIAAPSEAIPEMLRQATRTLPYIATVLAVIFIYRYAFDTHLNEITAPIIMPVVMLVVVIFDKWLESRTQPLTNKLSQSDEVSLHSADRQVGIEPSIRAATTEGTGHIGALIMLMGLSLTVGGIVERSEVMDMAPKVFPNIWLAMAFLVVTKVILGIFMDPFGAIILVSGTMAPIAYSNGIDPVHFWMMVLVAFELGYLMPPVALNQLLTRQVIGDQEVQIADNEVKDLSFFRRYERWILPSAVMTVGLLIVAFGPLAVQQFSFLGPIKNIFSH